MDFPYIHVKQEDLPNIFSSVRAENLPHFSIPVPKIVEATTLASQEEIYPPFTAVKIETDKWRLINRKNAIVEIHGFTGPLPEYILTEDIVKAIAKKFNAKWGF